MVKIQRNRHPAGRLQNIEFGICCILDGLVRIVSLGFLHSTFTLEQTARVAKSMFKKSKAAAKKDKPIKVFMSKI